MPSPVAFDASEESSGSGGSSKQLACESAHDEVGSGIGCDSEKVLPQQPRRWAALPPTRHASSSSRESDSEQMPDLQPKQPKPWSALPPGSGTIQSAPSEEELGSSFNSVLTMFSQQLHDVHRREVDVLSAENEMLRYELQRLGFKRLDPSSALTSSQDSMAFAEKTSYASFGTAGSKPWMPSSSFRSRQSAMGTGTQSSFTMMSKKSQSRLFDPSGGHFMLREEWAIDDAELMRIATKGTFDRTDELPSIEHRRSAGAASYTSEFMRRRVPLHPEHKFRLCWDLMAAVLLAYDTVMLPLYLFEIKSEGATKFLDWSTAVFWTVDIPASLCTGVFIKGRLEMSYERVAKQYGKTWMFPDLMMVVVEWILITVGVGGSGVLSSVGAMRNMRVLRFVRLVRLVKFERLISQLTRRINSVYLLLSLRIIRMVIAILVANHILASSWYAIGISGWVENQELDKGDVLYCYLTAFHWSLTQFHGSMEIAPRSLNERLFAVLVLLTALVAFSWFLSSMTNSMIMLQNIHQERTAQQRTLLGYLGQRVVSQALAVRIKQYIDTFHKENPAIIQEKEVALLTVLPKGLMTDLHAEVRGRRIVDHPLFDHFNEFYTHFLRHLCHDGVEEVYASRKDIIFCTGEACSRMLYVNSEVSYAPGQLRNVSATATLSDVQEMVKSVSTGFRRRSDSRTEDDKMVTCVGNTWLSEAVLWTVWSNCGTLVALEDTFAYALKVETFLKQIMLYEEVRLDATVYAKVYIEYLNSVAPSDLPDRVNAHEVWAEVYQDPAVSSKRASVISQGDRRAANVLFKGLKKAGSALSLTEIVGRKSGQSQQSGRSSQAPSSPRKKWWKLGRGEECQQDTLGKSSPSS